MLSFEAVEIPFIRAEEINDLFRTAERRLTPTEHSLCITMRLQF